MSGVEWRAMRLAGRLLGLLVAALASFAALAAELGDRVIASSLISAVPTNLSSNTETMVSYRHQERMWQGADGSLHLVVNRGTLQPNPGIVLTSSYDGGITWTVKQVFGNTDKDSTADSLMNGSMLWLAYGDANGALIVAQLTYDSVAQSWTLLRSEIAFASTQFEGINPTLGIDDSGVVWCSFAAMDRNTADINLRMVYRQSDSAPWADTGLVFGPTDNLSKERSARPVRLPNGMGLLYRVRQSMYWATRANGAPFGSPWPSVKISEGALQRPISDPYASHFSVIGEGDAHLHLAIADDGDVQYLRYTTADDSWTAARKINGRKKVSYLQIGLFNGQIALALSATRGDGGVLVSSDHGASFSTQVDLALPPAADGVNYKTGRVEMAAVSVGGLTVLQQYEERRQQRLMVFKIPAN
ncbi:hypothetical protein [Aquabacterium sp.]|uniref:hypothetical protein n=1 Tax=Aquabacterium sp. TaxID=1872578 RepID=UPI002CE6E00B|nr:hypothetical protein [Aquabacterium sp.]HSW05270.1 hypothetical protein [Aquabacterium sp.]